MGCFSGFLNCTNGTKSRKAPHITYQVSLYLWRIGPVLKHFKSSQNIMIRIARAFQPVSYLCFILTYFNISRRRSQLLCRKMIRKVLQTLPKNLCWSPFLTSYRPRVYNYIEIESPAQVFSSDFCEISGSSILQKNCERLLL